MKSKLILTLAFILSFTLSLPAAADHHMDYPMGKPYLCGMGKHMLKKLNLTDNQKKAVQDIRNQYKDQLKQDRQAMWTLRQDMRAVVHSDTLDQKKMEAVIEKKKAIVADMTKTRIMMMHQIYKVLDKDQKEKLAIMMKHKQEKMMKMKEMMQDKMMMMKNKMQDKKAPMMNQE